MNDSDIDVIIRLIEASVPRVRPLIVAIDGRSGAGKSTLAKRLCGRLPAKAIEGDDFYAGGVALRDDSPQQRAAACIDWRRERAVLTALRQNECIAVRRFDWDAFDGSLAPRPTVYEPAPVVLLEGVYSARPELADLVDLAILLRVPADRRRARLLAREGTIGAWERQWHEAEDHYFSAVTRERFDLVIEE